MSLAKDRKPKESSRGDVDGCSRASLRTKSIKYHIDKTEASPLCRLCGEHEETVAHIVSECKQLAQRQYKERRYDVIAKVIHWELRKVNDLPKAEKWYEHKPESVAESDQVKILRDFKIQTDKELKHNKPSGGWWDVFFGGGANFQILGVAKTNFGSHTTKAFIT